MEREQLSVYSKEFYSFYDEKSETFSNPFLANNSKEAERIACTVLISGDNLISTNYEDFKLYCVGSFDIRTGKVLGLDIPVLINSCASLMESITRKMKVPSLTSNSLQSEPVETVSETVSSGS